MFFDLTFDISIRRTCVGMQEARFWPGRASSRDINVTASDETADSLYRKRSHDTPLERHGSFRTDKMATNGGRARTPSGRLIPEGPKCAPNASETAQNGNLRVILGCLEVATPTTAHVMIIGRPGVRWCGRLGSRRTQKCLVRRPRCRGLLRVRLAPYI